jgi:hypothetical protein
MNEQARLSRSGSADDFARPGLVSLPAPASTYFEAP